MIAERDRTRPLVALVFLPGLICLLLSALISILIAFLIISMGFIAVSSIDRVPIVMVIFMVAIAVGGLLGAYFSFKGGMKALKEVPYRSLGYLLQENDAKKLFTLINETAQEMKILPPRFVILEMGMNFYVTEKPVIAINGSTKGRALGISAPMLRAVTIDELKSILSHEFAHFSGKDTVYSQYFLPVYRAVLSTLQEMRNVNETDSRGTSLPLLIPMALLRLYLSLFSRVERKISRDREMRADRIGVQMTSLSAFSAGLIKVYALGQHWQALTAEWISESLQQELIYENISTTYIDTVIKDVEWLEESLKETDIVKTHPMDTHPSLRERLINIGADPDYKIIFSDGPHSEMLVPELEGYETQLTHILTQIIAQLNPNVDRELVERL